MLSVHEKIILSYLTQEKVMKEKLKQYLNIYFVIGFIGLFSLLYMLSFVFILSDIQNGSSAKIKQEKMQKQKEQQERLK